MPLSLLAKHVDLSEDELLDELTENVMPLGLVAISRDTDGWRVGANDAMQTFFASPGEGADGKV